MTDVVSIAAAPEQEQMRQVKFVDLAGQYRRIQGDIQAAIQRVLDSGQYVLGDEVKAFEQSFAQYSGAAFGIAVNSGTSALHLALLAAGVGRDDEVITVPFTFVATVAAICYTGARPVFVDVDQSGTMDTASLEHAITPRTKAILPVHLYGAPADMDGILDIAQRRGLKVIEDACQAHGAEYRGRRVGAIGDYGAFSFYPGKNLGAYGEGGMVVTNSEKGAAIVRALRDHGQSSKYRHQYKGFNYRMEGLQGAILRTKLHYLEEWTEARRRHARAYLRSLDRAKVSIPATRSDCRHVYHLFTVLTADRDELRAHLSARGIQSGIHYPVSAHLHEGYRDLGYVEGDFPVSEDFARRTLSLPMYPEMHQDDIDAVVRAIASF